MRFISGVQDWFKIQKLQCNIPIKIKNPSITQFQQIYEKHLKNTTPIPDKKLSII